MSPRTIISALAVAAGVAALAPASAGAAIVVANAKPVSGVEGAPLRPQRVVSFDDAGACDRGAYQVTVSWGDGETSDAQIAKSVQAFPGTCTYDASAEHTYAAAGQYAVTATICRGAECATTPIAGTAAIADAEVRGEVLPSLGAVATQAFSGQVAELKDANAASRQSDFAATIDWGDGTAPSAGRLAGTAGNYLVEGSHTYAAPGSYRVAVTAVHNGRSIVLDPATIAVAAAPTTPQASSTVLPTGTLRVLGRVSLRAVRANGLRVAVGVGRTAPRRLRIQVLDAGTGKRLWTGTVKPGKPTAAGLSIVRVKPSAKVRKRLRKGRNYVVRIPAQAGLPTLQVTFRVR